MKLTLTAGAVAMAFAASAAMAVEIDAIPSDGIYSSTETTYNGDGSDVVIDQIGHSEGALITGGAAYTLKGIGNLTIKSADPSNSWLYGIYANSSASSTITVEAAGDIYVEAREAALHGLSGGSVSVSGNNVTLVGTAETANAVVSQPNSTVNVTAAGDINISSAGTAMILYRASGAEGDIHSTLTAGGEIKITSTNSSAISLSSASFLNIGAKKGLTVDGNIRAAQGTIALTEEANKITLLNDSTADIGTLKLNDGASTEFVVDHIGTADAKVLNVATIEGANNTFTVNYTGNASDALVAGSKAEDLFNGVTLGSYELKQVSVAEGAWGDAGVYTLNADGTVKADIRSTNSLLASATDLALMNGLVWRTQLSNLSDRMGTLRTMPEAAGLWVRYNNGRFEGRGIEHDYNVIELGVDSPVSDNFLFGVSFDYTIGDTDLHAGSADNDTYTLGVYGSYFSDNGAFVDMMAKIGRIDSEYDLNNGVSEKGDYMMTGAIIGIEAGHRFDIIDRFFVEPQVQLSYSWLRASDYTTNVRSVDFDTVESLIARVGFMGGLKFAQDRGAAYFKASYNHDFLGDVDAYYTSRDGSYSRSISDELDDNWGEVSIGASYSITDSLHTFLDVGTGFGGDIDQKWRVNVGGKYMF